MAIAIGAVTTNSGCALSGSNASNGVDDAVALDRNAVDSVPVARFTTAADVDDAARCIGQGWARLSVIGPGKVTLHPSLRGLMVDVKASSDPLARAYVDVYAIKRVTHIDYFVRSFVQDPDEDLRFRAMQACIF